MKLSKFTPKLTEEMKTYAVTKLACDIPTPQIVKDIKKNYNVDISLVRLRCLIQTKRFGELYEVVRNKYLTDRADLSDIALYSKRKRLEQITKMNDRIYHIVELLGDRISKGSANTYDIALSKELRGVIETNLKVLKQAKDESEDDNKNINGRGSKSVSLLQIIDNQQINVEKKKE